MKSTNEIRQRLRKMINDVIPENEVVDDLAFTDGELDQILLDSANIYQAAAEVWMIKASMLQADIESYTAGNERYQLTSLKDRQNYAINMADRFEAKSKTIDADAAGSILLKFNIPDVM